MLKEEKDKGKRFQAHMNSLWEELHPLAIETIQQALRKNLAFLKDNYKNSEARVIQALEKISHRLGHDDEDR